jgi:hypothetical protein
LKVPVLVHGPGHRVLHNQVEGFIPPDALLLVVLLCQKERLSALAGLFRFKLRSKALELIGFALFNFVEECFLHFKFDAVWQRNCLNGRCD